MGDIIVTTPKCEMGNAAQEAAEVIADGGGWYFRVLRLSPRGVRAGDRVFYVEDGYIRGFGIIGEIMMAEKGARFVCDTTGRTWGGRTVVRMDATTWQWIKPIPMRGFQGWRYFTAPDDMEVIGGWLDPKPPPPTDRAPAGEERARLPLFTGRTTDEG